MELKSPIFSRRTTMNIKLELLKSYITDVINSNIESFEIDENEIADTLAINMLREIQSIVKNENYSDFEAIEKIVCLLEKLFWCT